MTPVLVFDIETVPDIEGLRKLDLPRPLSRELGHSHRRFRLLHSAFSSRRECAQ